MQLDEKHLSTEWSLIWKGLDKNQSFPGELSRPRTILLGAYWPFRASFEAMQKRLPKLKRFWKIREGEDLRLLTKFEASWRVRLYPGWDGKIVYVSSPIAEAITLRQDLSPSESGTLRPDLLLRMGYLDVFIDLTKGPKAIKSSLDRLMVDISKISPNKDAMCKARKKNASRLPFSQNSTDISYPDLQALLFTSDWTSLKTSADRLKQMPGCTVSSSPALTNRVAALIEFLDPNRLGAAWVDWQRPKKEKDVKAEKEAAEKAFKDGDFFRSIIERPSEKVAADPWGLQPGASTPKAGADLWPESPFADTSPHPVVRKGSRK